MTHTSSTDTIPDAPRIPRHVAIIMDGNGRWAAARHMPRVAGHSKGVDAVRATVQACVDRGVDYLTLFAFSSENWRRPADEVSLLMRLFIMVLEREVTQMRANGIRNILGWQGEEMRGVAGRNAVIRNTKRGSAFGGHHAE